MEILQQYTVPVIMAICLALGHIIKTSADFIPNKYIPLIMGVLGVVLNVWIAGTIDPSILLAGMFSGLSRTGAHQLFNNLLEK